MKYRTFGKTGWQVSEVGLGTWALGSDAWGDVDEEQALEVLDEAQKQGINFFDTADVYGDGTSEKRIARSLKNTDERIYVATKFGRRLDPHTSSGYTKGNLEGFLERSLRKLEMDTVDLVQLHCPPTEVYYRPEIFEAMEDFVDQGMVRYYGVSVEKVEEGLKALEYPNLASVQIIFNMFRQRPADLFFERASERDVAIITRVPLASGLLTGKYDRTSEFPENDHRNFNRKGEEFDVGETFAGVNFETGLDGAAEIEEVRPQGFTMAQLAIKWILEHDDVNVVIPGAKNRGQVRDNTEASDLPGLPDNVMDKVDRVYEKHVKEQVHQRW
ncbi:aldo/keto reductase [Candidatus Bipolaricaulota bacterium]|nr:aldo/keto reductase [Candidatus Bipolaricaulota bacterium]